LDWSISISLSSAADVSCGLVGSETKVSWARGDEMLGERFRLGLESLEVIKGEGPLMNVDKLRFAGDALREDSAEVGRAYGPVFA
jgi:hypothetical protein